jgi:RNA polymerase sigma-B factor
MRRESEEAPRARLREDRALLERYATRPTADLREAIIDRFLPLARHLAARYARTSSEPVDDLFQVAALGLVKAVDHYDVDRGVAFSSYAVPTMLGEIKRYFRDRTWSVHVPRDLQELTLAVQSQRDRLEGSLGRAPTLAEIAQTLDVSDDEVLDALEAARAQRADSLDAPAESDDDQGNTVLELIGAADPAIERAETRASVDTLMSVLPRRSRLMLRLRFDHDMTQREIGEIVGLSQMQVSRIVRESIDRMRDAHDRRRPGTCSPTRSVAAATTNHTATPAHVQTRANSVIAGAAAVVPTT